MLPPFSARSNASSVSSILVGASSSFALIATAPKRLFLLLCGALSFRARVSRKIYARPNDAFFLPERRGRNSLILSRRNNEYTTIINKRMKRPPNALSPSQNSFFRSSFFFLLLCEGARLNMSSPLKNIKLSFLPQNELTKKQAKKRRGTTELRTLTTKAKPREISFFCCVFLKKATKRQKWSPSDV